MRAIGFVGIEPQSWLTEWPRNTFMLILVGIWMWVGFATVILSAGLKGISTELLEAARMDGATELQVFFRIILPLLAPTVAVVGTTIVITALKTFDIVYVMTGGQYGTEVIGTARSTTSGSRTMTLGPRPPSPSSCCSAIIPVMLVNIRPLPGAGGDPMTERGQPAIPVNPWAMRGSTPPTSRRAASGRRTAAGSAARRCTPS